MSPSPYLITGAGTDVQPRLEIHDLVKEEKQFTLFVFGWNKIRESDYEPAAVRYSEQAGIHGMPYKSWIGDPGKTNSEHPQGEKDEIFKGYCNHASVLFPTWHRPSLMLLEQSIWIEANKKAEEFATSHPKEADDWRQLIKLLISYGSRGYWDWTDGRETKQFPKIFREEEVELRMPEGKTENHLNPLHTYKLPSPLPNGFKNKKIKNKVLFPKDDGTPEDEANRPTAWFGEWKRTYRWPGLSKVEPRENIEILDDTLNGGKQYPKAPAASWNDLLNQVSPLFLYPPMSKMPKGSEAYAWDKFSNTRAMSHPSEEEWDRPGTGPYWDIAKALRCLASIETSHNLLHLLIGGMGHMMDNDYASFDPIFFLHHCNVDRIFALWEDAYPDYYMGYEGYTDKDGSNKKFRQSDGKWGWPNDPDSHDPIESAVELRGDTPLTPFRKGDGSYWTSDDVRWGSKIPKNYTYKDIHVKQDGFDPLGPRTEFSMKCCLSEPHSETRPERDAKELQEKRATLQRAFGFNPVPVRQRAIDTIGALDLPLPQDEEKKLTYPVTNEDQLTSGYEKIHDYRHYVVRIVLNPYALGSSYSVNIRYHTPGYGIKDKDIISGHIGSASSLVRSENTECGACQARMKAGVKSVYNVMVPHEIITKMAAHSGKLDTMGLILASLSADITLPSGYIVADTLTGDMADAKPIPEELIPEISLLSSALQALPDGIDHVTHKPQGHAPRTPYETYDWQHHKVVFEKGQWRAVLLHPHE